MSRILLDENLPLGVATLLTGHDVGHVVRESWQSFSNGRLLNAAEEAGYDVLVTAYRNDKHQQNLAGRRLAILVLNTNGWPIVRREIAQVAMALGALSPGQIVELNLMRC